MKKEKYDKAWIAPCEEPREEGLDDATCSLSFSDERPTSEGCYWMTCMENDNDPEWVQVFKKYGKLMATIDCGTYALADICAALTDVKWSHAISISDNS